MSKVNTIKLVNFKAIDEFVADFKGCTAIVTAGNDKGKTSFLRGIIDRIRFIRPDKMVKNGQTEGKGELTLDTGEKFSWEFDINGKDKLVYTDKEGVKQTVTVAIGNRFFPPTFEIDKFLESTPAQQIKQLQKIVGVDFTDVEERYVKAYAHRTAKNADAEKFHAKLTQMMEVDKVDFVDLDKLQKEKEVIREDLNLKYKANKAHNDKLRTEWNEAKSKIDDEVFQHNKTQSERHQAILRIEKYRDNIIDICEEASILNLVDISKLDEHIKNMPVAEPGKIASDFYPSEPVYIKEMPDDTAMRVVDEKIITASKINAAAQQYKDFVDYKATVEAAKIEAEEADAEVKAIEAERKALVASANFPKGVTINNGHVEVDGFVFDKNQLSTSKLYTTALRIAAMNLGEVRSLYFDASYLDKNTLREIQDWATANDLQLLIERPDFDDGDIKYVILEN